MKTLKEVAELLSYSDWQKIKAYHRNVCGLIAADNDEVKIFSKNKARNEDVLSYENLRKALRVQTSEGVEISGPITTAYAFPRTKKDNKPNKAKFDLHVNSFSFSPSGSKAFFTCTDCRKEFMVECNFATWSKYFDCLCCKSCKKKTVSRTKTYIDKYENSMLEKYGCRRPLQNKSIMKKFTTKMKEVHGVEYSAQSKELYLKTLNNTSWKNHTSKKERALAEAVQKLIPDVSTCLSGKKPQITCGVTTKYPDIMFESRIVEFFGNYWRANPAMYNRTSKLPNGKTASEIWAKDKERINLLNSLGYSVMIVWEQDWDQNKETVLRSVQEFLNGN